MIVDFIEVRVSHPHLTVTVGLIATQIDKHTWRGGRTVRVETAGPCDRIHIESAFKAAFDTLEQEQQAE